MKSRTLRDVPRTGRLNRDVMQLSPNRDLPERRPEQRDFPDGDGRHDDIPSLVVLARFILAAVKKPDWDTDYLRAFGRG